MSAPEPGPVGFVGLGSIGKPMASRLVDWPGGLWVHDIEPEPLAELEKAGAGVENTVAELASRVDVLCVMVRDDDQVREVVGRALGAAREGLTLAVHSTIAPDTAEQLGDLAARHDVRVVDAPVSGGPMGAVDGNLAIMVGGGDDAFAACSEPLGRMGAKVVHAGPLGSGTRMKLARNLLHFASFTAATEAQRLAEAAGLDLVELGRVVRHTDAITGGPGAIMHRDTTAELSEEDPWFEIFEHVRALGDKDLRYALDLARQAGVETPMASQALRGLATGLGLPGDAGPSER